jgi:hypothetical protein
LKRQLAVTYCKWQKLKDRRKGPPALRKKPPEKSRLLCNQGGLCANVGIMPLRDPLIISFDSEKHDSQEKQGNDSRRKDRHGIEDPSKKRLPVNDN